MDVKAARFSFFSGKIVIIFSFIFSAPGLVVDHWPNLCLLTLTPVSVEGMKEEGWVTRSPPTATSHLWVWNHVTSPHLVAGCGCGHPPADVWPSSVVSVSYPGASVLLIAIGLAAKLTFSALLTWAEVEAAKSHGSSSLQRIPSRLTNPTLRPLPLPH